MKPDLPMLDLSGLEQFKASTLLAPAATAGPLQVALDMIEFDPKQPRRTLHSNSLQALAASIQMNGVLEPISLRTNPDAADRYIVNRGERRVRASRLAGIKTVPAFLDERVDPYAQAAENLHREDMSPFDVALFVAEREAEGTTRAEIARKLGKPRSFITEVAALIGAPDALRHAFDTGRVQDRRTLYTLAHRLREAPDRVDQVLAGEGPITRRQIAARCANSADLTTDTGSCVKGQPAPSACIPRESSRGSSLMEVATRPALLVSLDGQQGTLQWHATQQDTHGEVVFRDGRRRTVALRQLQIVAWSPDGVTS